MDIVERLRSDYGIGYEARIEAADEIEELTERVDVLRKVLKDQVEKNKRLQEVVMLLIKFDEHNEDIYRGAVMWEVLIESAHAALKEKE